MMTPPLTPVWLTEENRAKLAHLAAFGGERNHPLTKAFWSRIAAALEAPRASRGPWRGRWSGARLDQTAGKPRPRTSSMAPIREAV